MRRVLNRLWLCVAALPLFSGCMNYDDCGNTSLDYESLDVSFKATLPPLYNLNEEMSFGACGICTRGGKTDVNMSAVPVSKMGHTMAAPYYFFSKTEGDAIVGKKGDHNYRFYAYYPYDPSCTDMAAVPVNIPSVITYDKNAPALSPLIVANATVTSIIAPVPMSFSAPASCQMTVRIPDTACKVIKSIRMYPGNETWKGRFAFSGTYDVFEQKITEDPTTVSKSITVDFGPSGYEMKPGYLTVSFLMGEAKYVTGGVKLAVTDIDGVTTVKDMYNARQTFDAGSSYTFTMK
ncbi:MAG: fimbrillin family protein [Bacteroidales bacterium]|nr:fimbrillin family protein [Bacteroidales bacterium]